MFSQWTFFLFNLFSDFGQILLHAFRILVVDDFQQILQFQADVLHLWGSARVEENFLEQVVIFTQQSFGNSHVLLECSAWSDAAQQVTPDVLDYILNLLVIRKETQSTENLSELRKQIDECDNNLIQELAKRMRVAREIGTYKKEHDMTILQTGRYNEILEKRGSQGALCGMDAEFIKKVFEAIHEESVRQQMEIINK